MIRIVLRELAVMVMMFQNPPSERLLFYNCRQITPEFGGCEGMVIHL